MNRDQLAGGWREFRGAIQKEWGNLTDDELDQSQGRFDELVGSIQRRYGGSREQIERRLREIQAERRL